MSPFRANQNKNRHAGDGKRVITWDYVVEGFLRQPQISILKNSTDFSPENEESTKRTSY